jgi:hypothetical protein
MGIVKAENETWQCFADRKDAYVSHKGRKVKEEKK